MTDAPVRLSSRLSAFWRDLGAAITDLPANTLTERQRAAIDSALRPLIAACEALEQMVIEARAEADALRLANGHQQDQIEALTAENALLESALYPRS